MPKSRLHWFGLIIVSAGCAQPERIVSVDTSAAALSESPRFHAAPPAQPASQPYAGGAWVAPAWKGVAFRTASKRHAERAAALVARNLENAERELRQQYYRAYRRSLERWRAGQEDSLNESTKQREDAAYSAISALLIRYAEQRMPVLNRLSFLTGFPIEPPSEWEAVPEARVWRQNQRREALSLYPELLALDNAFEREASEILSATREANANERAELQVEWVERLDEALRQAAIEAARALRESRMEWSGELAELTLGQAAPAVQARVRFEPVEGIVHVAPVPRSSRLEGWRLHALAIDLAIWRAQENYRLSDRPFGARDATGEFLEWRRTRHPGP